MTHRLARRPLTVVGAPSSAGAYGPGQELAPMAFRRHGLIESLRAAGLEVTDRGDGRTVEWRPDVLNPAAANPDLVIQVAADLADTVENALAGGSDVLVLGGDCTIELGAVAGASRGRSSTGVVYIDLDADLHTPDTGDGVLDWMVVAHLLGVPGVHEGVSTLGGRRSMLSPEDIRLFSTANITAPEAVVIDRLGLHVEPLSAVTGETEQVLARTRAWAGAFDRLLVHLDVDVLDYEKFPIAENTDRRGGLTLRLLTDVLVALCSLPNWRALTLTEVNPRHAPDEARSFDALIGMLATALTGAPLPEPDEGREQQGHCES